MNRGSKRVQAAFTAIEPTRFNEAPIHESGKYSLRMSTAATVHCSFNEAPIHESGKYSLPSSGNAIEPTSGFNEAPIHESGKYSPLRMSTASVRVQLQ